MPVTQHRERQTVVFLHGLGADPTSWRPVLEGLPPGFTARTLVLCGSRDRVNLPAARRLAAEIPHARLLVVSGAGHEWNARDPARFTAVLGEFLDSRT